MVQKKSDKAATLRKAAQIKAAKAKAALEAKASQTSALRKLAPLAKEINARMDKAAVAEVKASDHQLSAAICLAKAKAECVPAKISFTKWCEANITKSWETARKLAVIGASSDPKQALADMRISGAKREAKSQTKLQSTRSGVSTRSDTGPSETPPTSYQTAVSAFAALDAKAAMNLVVDIAAEQKKRVISDHDHNELADLRKSLEKVVGAASLERVQHDFDGLSAPDKMLMAQYAAKKVGVKLLIPDFNPTADNAGRPDFLDRNKPVTGKKAKKTKKTQTITRGAVA